ncbi:MAG: TrkA family potassium uptake protein [Deltaproteobacteria bacterium]|nr:MAG: TrkA family potassium uptake protein [Deltaproteobacteria bacterium]
MERIAVIGLGRFGGRLSRSLTELGAEVLAIDARQDAVDTVRDHVALAVALDVTDEEAFGSSGVADVDIAVVAIGKNLEGSILVAAQLVRLAVPHIVARASSELHAQILRLLGVHDVVNLEASVGDSVARRLVSPDLHERQQLPTGHEYSEVETRPAQWGRSLAELALAQKYRVTPLAIRRQRAAVDDAGRSVVRAELIVDPDPAEVIREGDRIGVIGTAMRLRQLARARDE